MRTQEAGRKGQEAGGRKQETERMLRCFPFPALFPSTSGFSLLPPAACILILLARNTLGKFTRKVLN